MSVFATWVACCLRLSRSSLVLTCQGGDWTKAMYPAIRGRGWGGHWIDAASALRMADEIGGLDPITEAADPYGNHAAQAMHLGLALGCDLHLVLDSAKIQESGVPRSVLAQFPERLPVRLDAAFHRHHDLRFLPEAVQMTLSFDALYTCVFPWDAIQQVTIFPLPPELDEPEEEPEEEPEPTSRRGHLRLLD